MASDKKSLEKQRKRLTSIIQHWNESRLDLFAISLPDEKLECHGVMRFYHKDSTNNGKYATKCIRVSSNSSTKDVVEMLSTKFRPDMRMLTKPKYVINEVHVDVDGADNYEMRQLKDKEKPILVQLSWIKDDREGRFLLHNVDDKAPVRLMDQFVGPNNEDSSFKLTRNLTKKEKKLKKKQEKEKTSKKNSNSTDGGSDARLQEIYTVKHLYSQVPESTFMRTVSNPEAVMKKRREHKLQKRGAGILKVYGDRINPEIPYKSLLLLPTDNVTTVTRDALDKYGLGKEQTKDYKLIQVVLPPNSKPEEMLNGGWGMETVLVDPKCPLDIEQNWKPHEGTLVFQLRHIAIDSKNSKKSASPPSSNVSATEKTKENSEYFQITDDIFMDKKKPLKEGAKIFEGYQEHVGGERLPLAIKVIFPSTTKSVREVQHLISLASHPNVVRIISSKEHNDRLPTLYIAMELCSSQNLHDYLNENRKKNIPFDFKKTMLYSEGLIHGIKHIHRKRIIHGDLKPANILFSLLGDQIKISDFGISKNLQHLKSVTKITSQGTDGYRAPETYSSYVISMKADIYSLGIILYSLFANGKHPFGEDLDLWMYNIKKNVGRDFSGLPEEMGAKNYEFVKLLEKMLEFDPERRPTIEEISEHPFFNSNRSTIAQEMCSHTNITNITNYNITGDGSTVVTAPVGQLAAGNANITNQGARNNFVAGSQENTDRTVTAGKATYGQSTSSSVGENITVHRTGK